MDAILGNGFLAYEAERTGVRRGYMSEMKRKRPGVLAWVGDKT